MPLTVVEREPPMLPSAACCPAIHGKVDCAAANWGICGGTVAALAGGGDDSNVADARRTAPARRQEAPVRVRRMLGMDLASRTSTRKTPHLRGYTESRSLCLDGGNSPDLEVSRLMMSPRRCTTHGCGPAPEFHRLPLAGSTDISVCCWRYGTAGGQAGGLAPANQPAMTAGRATIDGTSACHSDDLDRLPPLFAAPGSYVELRRPSLDARRTGTRVAGA